MAGQNDSMADRIHMLDAQDLTLAGFPAEGWVLDIGGGGEGVIGRLLGRQVVAIDTLEEELVEAPDGPLKVVMDARDLRFLDGTFGTATVFFSLIYLRTQADVDQVFAEVYRVLQPGGQFLIWGMAMESRPAESEKDLIAIPLTLHLPDAEVSTAYGCRWYDEPRSAEATTASAERAGFEVVSQGAEGHVYTLVLRKGREG